MNLKEGKVTVEIPGSADDRGPGRAEPGFYNRSQKLNRDVTILFLNWARPKLALDGFGGTGIRGIRFAVESGVRTVISERNTVSSEIIRKNIEASGADVSLQKDTFQCALSQSLFDFIDIDPYGSSVPYMDQAIASVRNRGYVAVTATDLSALTGSVPTKTWIRYGASVSNDAYRHETGVRLLAGTFARRAVNLEREAVPVVSLWHSHYYRIIFRVTSGTSRSIDNLNQIGYVNKHDTVSKLYPNSVEGPLWTGKLYSAEFLEKLEVPEYLKADGTLMKYVEYFPNEDIRMYFTDVGEIGRLRHESPVPLKKLVRTLSDNGLSRMGRTQFSPTGLKADISMDEAMGLLA